MCRLNNKTCFLRRFYRAAFFFPAVFGFWSCGIISLADMGIVTWPESRDQVLSEGEEIWAEFSIKPETWSAESCASVRGGASQHSIDFRWDGGRMYMTPVPPLDPGRRYVLYLSGSLQAADGRTFSVQRVIPFFSVSAEGPLEIIAVSPKNGSDASPGTPLVFTLNRAVHRADFREALDVSPRSGYSLRFSEEDRVVTVTPEPAWDCNTLYTWSLGTGAGDASGITLASGRSGGFRVQEDREPPLVLSVSPAFYSSGTWLKLPGLGRKDPLLLELSEDVDLDSLAAAFSLSPVVNGSFLHPGRGRFVFLPEGEFVMDTEYLILINGELKDLAGNHCKAGFSTILRTDIPPQVVESILFMDDRPETDPVEITAEDLAAPNPVVILFGGVEPDLSLLVSINFLEPYDEPYREALTRRIQVSAFFPDFLPDPSRVSAVWSLFNTCLTLEYEGFKKSEPPDPPLKPAAEKKLYRLFIPGGREFSENRNGSWLREDVRILLEAQE